METDLAGFSFAAPLRNFLGCNLFSAEEERRKVGPRRRARRQSEPGRQSWGLPARLFAPPRGPGGAHEGGRGAHGQSGGAREWGRGSRPVGRGRAGPWQPLSGGDFMRAASFFRRAAAPSQARRGGAQASGRGGPPAVLDAGTPCSLPTRPRGPSRASPSEPRQGPKTPASPDSMEGELREGRRGGGLTNLRARPPPHAGKILVNCFP